MSTQSEAWFTRFSVTVVLIAICCGPAGAHHSFASIYDSEKAVTFEASVREFQFIHPHPFLVVEVRNGDGERQIWRAEMDNRSELEGIGITRTTFRLGDQVIVSGSPGRSQPFILYLWRLDRPADRLRYQQIGGTPRLDKMPLGIQGK